MSGGLEKEMLSWHTQCVSQNAKSEETTPRRWASLQTPTTSLALRAVDLKSGVFHSHPYFQLFTRMTHRTQKSAILTITVFLE